MHNPSILNGIGDFSRRFYYFGGWALIAKVGQKKTHFQSAGRRPISGCR
jgi:hypothetical protein